MRRIAREVRGTKFLRFGRAVALGAAATLLLGSAATPALAQCTDTWTGAAGDNSWSNGANWSTGMRPGSGDSVCIQLGNAAVNDDQNNGSISNLTLGSTDSITLPLFYGTNNYLVINGTSIANSGQIILPVPIGQNQNSSTLYIGSGTTTTLSGGGSVTLNENAQGGDAISGTGPGGILLNQSTIQGGGYIENDLTLNNASAGVINANISGYSLDVGRLGPSTNTGLMEATNGSLLVMGSFTLNNVGGQIQAVGTGSAVQVYGLGQGGQTITGGTYTTSSGGQVQLYNSTLIDGTNGNTVTNTGTMVIPDAFTNPSAAFQGTLSNTGTLQILSAGNPVGLLIPSGQNLTVMGSGHLTMGDGTNNTYNTQPYLTGESNGANLVNQSTIQGTGIIQNGLSVTNSGTINANVATGANNLQLWITRLESPGLTNTGTLEATNGGALILGGVSVTGTGGTFKAVGTGSYVDTLGSTITGGTFSTSSSGTIYLDNNSGTDSTLDGITNNGSMTIQDGNFAIFSDTVTNNGTISVNVATADGGISLPVGVTTTFKGTGSITFASSSHSIIGATTCGSATFINASTIKGSVVLFPNTNCFSTMTNSGTLLANQSVPMNLVAAHFTNTGTLSVAAGSTMNLPSGASNFTNLVSGTLTGGKYTVTGTLTIPGNITTNNAGITLSGTSSQILNPTTNALAGFVTNGNKGSFTLAGNQSFIAPGAFSNQGVVTISKGSTFTVAGSGSYSQTGGKTIVNGTLAFSTSPSFPGGDVFFPAAGSANIQKGSLFGAGGRVAANLKSGGSVTPGNSATTTGVLAVAGTYTQTVAGALNANVGGTTLGTQYGQLSSTGAATLSGTLNIALINNFVPAVGNTFVILKASSVTGTFATVNGTSINTNEHFQVTYNTNNVTLQVVAGP